MGRQERRELANRLQILLGHLLKGQYQSGRRRASGEAAIAVQRDDIQDLLRDNPSLKPFLPEAFAAGDRQGRLRAIAETDLPPATFLDRPPFNLDDALAADLERG